MSFEGSFNLRNATDLFRKLEHDLDRMRKDPSDGRPAFDFFVTALHMLDWVYPNDKGKKDAELKDNQLLLICSHIGNGSKHFRATRSYHNSVRDTVVHLGDFSSQDFSPEDFDTTRLEVELQGDAAAALGNTISANDLATRILDF